MGYRSVPPVAALAPWVDACWEVTWHEPWPVLVVPDGYVDVVLNLEPAIAGLLHAGHGVAAGQVVVGMHRHFSNLASAPGTEASGIRFRAGGLAQWVATPSLHEVGELTIDAQVFAPALKALALKAAPALGTLSVAEAPTSEPVALTLHETTED